MYSAGVQSGQNQITTKREFTTGGIRFVEHMEFMEVVSFLGEGVGASLFLLGIIFNSFAAMLVGFVFVGIAVIALMAHLGSRVLIAWRAVTRIKQSWVARGSLFISLFMAASAVLLVVELVAAESAIVEYLQSVVAVLSVLVVLYAGMMLRSMKAVTFWRTFYLPLSFVLHSIATSMVIFLAFFQSAAELKSVSVLMSITLIFLVISFLVSIGYLLFVKRTVAVRASVNALIKGNIRYWYLLGAGLVGLVLPTVLIAAVAVVGDPSKGGVVLVIAAALRLFGDYAYRYSVVKTGAYEPVIPPARLRPSAVVAE